MPAPKCNLCVCSFHRKEIIQVQTRSEKNKQKKAPKGVNSMWKCLIKKMQKKILPHILCGNYNYGSYHNATREQSVSQVVASRGFLLPCINYGKVEATLQTANGLYSKSS